MVKSRVPILSILAKVSIFGCILDLKAQILPQKCSSYKFSLDGPGRKENELMLGVILLRFGLNVKLRSKSQYYRYITNLIAIENIAYSLSFCGHRSLLSIQSNSQ